MASSSFVDRSGPGGIVHNPAAPYAREMAKWEMGYSPFGPPGRPREVVGHQSFPAMFYKMRRSTSNGDMIVEHYQEAADEKEATQLERQGYRLGRVAAIAYVEALEQEISVAAAERNAQDRRMSDKAKAESEAFEATTITHVAEIPEQVRRGWPKGKPRPKKLTTVPE